MSEQTTEKKNKGGRPRKGLPTPVMTIDEAINSLPETASPAVEIDWIRAHPAMRRKAETNNEVTLVVDDVIAITRGARQHPAAPSKSAVNSLHYYANHPAELHRMLMSEMKKKTNTDGTTAEADSEDVADIQKYLDQIEGL